MQSSRQVGSVKSAVVPRYFVFCATLALMSALKAGAARADLWAYVDEQGRSHVANRQVDSRYKLFFKGETTLDVPTGPAMERARAVARSPARGSIDARPTSGSRVVTRR